MTSKPVRVEPPLVEEEDGLRVNSDEEEDEEILGSDNDEQEDRKDYCVGMWLVLDIIIVMVLYELITYMSQS